MVNVDLGALLLFYFFPDPYVGQTESLVFARKGSASLNFVFYTSRILDIVATSLFP